MKRLALTLLAVVVLSTSCKGEEARSYVTTPPTLNPGRLTACTNTPFEPFEYMENGVLKGIDVDILTAAAEEMELQVEWREVPFDKIFEELEADRCDLVASGVSITAERQQRMAFSAGYFEVSQSLTVRSTDRTRYGTLADMAKGPIGVQKGTTGADYARAQAQGAEIKEYEDADALFAGLRAEEVVGAVHDAPIARFAARQDPAIHVVTDFTDVEREQYGFAMRRSSTQLQASLDASLERLRKDGRYDSILANYLSSAR